ncbi:SPOR domain-containing protein [Nitrosomonas sp. Nm166]|uniref:SPOR domain-containing protein n=1 Tax=Nitrosomonas sp. Nm166 TaxID=1881054 RepID=UPI0008ED4825|nr:SPOR domain-containing protein [Nitrosomonas sp. Nm166]SFE75576.1 Sporulation related domain-containing protein [Nitrosomonas sp. Nm166]
MKIIFVLLLIVNVAYGVGVQLHSNQKNTAAPKSFNSEKIVLLPVDENCLEWGNFYEEQIQYSEAVIPEIVSAQSYRVEEAGNAMMYWLYIPPLPNKEAANRVINKLRNLGIVSFLVRENDKWKNAISLGMLYDKKDALEQLEELEKKGIVNAMIEDRSVTLKKIVIPYPTQILKEKMQKLVESFDGTRLVQSKCERL